jgi:hypothetical protein
VTEPSCDVDRCVKVQSAPEGLKRCYLDEGHVGECVFDAREIRTEDLHREKQRARPI